MLVIDAVSSNFGVSINSLSIAHTNAGNLLVVNIAAGASDIVTGVTYNGVAMTRVDVRNNGNSTAYQYFLYSPSVGTFNIIISTSTLATISGDAISFTGAKQSGQPEAQATSIAGPSTSCGNTVTSITDNAVHVVAFAIDSVGITSWTNGTQIASGNGAYSNPLLISPPGGQTIAANSPTNNTWAAVGAIYAPAPETTSTTTTSTSSSTTTSTSSSTTTSTTTTSTSSSTTTSTSSSTTTTSTSTSTTTTSTSTTTTSTSTTTTSTSSSTTTSTSTSTTTTYPLSFIVEEEIIEQSTASFAIDTVPR